jgi:hypothetical protein
MKIKNLSKILLITSVFLLLFIFSFQISYGTTTFHNPIAANTLTDFFNNVLSWLRGIIVIIAIIFILIGGVLYMTSAGDEKRITTAKNTVTAAIIGLIIAVASPTFLKEILAVLGNNQGGGTAEDLVNSALSAQQIALNVMQKLLAIVGIVAIIGLVIGGFIYLTAYGDEKRVDDGKRAIKYSLIGIVIALASLLIVRQIIALLTTV